MMFMQSTLKPQFLLTLVASCVVASCLAKAQHMNAPDSPCQKPASNAEITLCFISASKTADERLNKLYGRIREVLSADEQRDLQSGSTLVAEVP